MDDGGRREGQGRTDDTFEGTVDSGLCNSDEGSVGIGLCLDGGLSVVEQGSDGTCYGSVADTAIDRPLDVGDIFTLGDDTKRRTVGSRRRGREREIWCDIRVFPDDDGS